MLATFLKIYISFLFLKIFFVGHFWSKRVLLLSPQATQADLKLGLPGWEGLHTSPQGPRVEKWTIVDHAALHIRP